MVLKKLNIKNPNKTDLKKWEVFVNRLKYPEKKIKIGLIGKYVELQDSYKSILESLIHAGSENKTKVEVKSIHSEFIDNNLINKEISNLDGILVAPGFGERGIEGKIEAIKCARENNIPFFGICLGMQMAVIEFSRNILKLKNANSTEMNKSTPDPVISLMENQKNITDKGGTMRLGAWKCKIDKDSLAYQIYKDEEISERHRHRWELNEIYLEKLNKHGLKTSGINPETKLVEIIEYPKNDWFIGVQFHPEYKSTVECPHPLFVSFVKGCLDYNQRINNGRKQD